MPALTILLLGDAERPEFRAAAESLRRWATVWRLADADEAAEAMREGRISPDALVVAQSFPGQFSEQAIERLRQLAPVARVLGLMGSWCEGEMRSGSPWPATARAYWHQWPARCDRELARLARGRSCAWALPPTASEEERLLANEDERSGDREITRQGDEQISAGSGISLSPCLPVSLSAPPTLCRNLAVVRSSSFAMWEWLAAACRSRGFSAVWQPAARAVHVQGAALGIFDATDLGPREEDALKKMTAALHPAPVVALISFPRLEDRQRALSAGAAAVLSKPVALEDLFGEMRVNAASAET
jgi:hypothetical protein